MGCGLGQASGHDGSETEGDDLSARTDQPLHLGIPARVSKNQVHALLPNRTRRLEAFAPGSQHRQNPPKKSRRRLARSSIPHPDASATSLNREPSFFGRFFNWMKSRVTKVNNKIFKSSAVMSRAKPTMGMHHSSSETSIVGHTSICPRSSASYSMEISAPKNGPNLGLSQQGPVTVEDGLLVRMEPPNNNAPYSNSIHSGSNQNGDITLHGAHRFSEKELREIQSGLLNMEVVAFEGPQVEMTKYEGFSQRVKTLGGTSHLRSSLPLYAAPECRPNAANPTTCFYFETLALSDWSQKGAISIGFSVPNYVGSVESKPSSLSIQGENGSLYYNNILLGDSFRSPFSSGSIGLGLLLTYNKERSTATTPAIDVQVLHSRQGQLLETVTLGRDVLGFDGYHDLFVDVQTVDKVEFEVVFERRWCRYKPVKNE